MPDLGADPVEGRAEGVGGDLGEDGTGPGADVGRVDPDGEGAVGQGPGGRGGRDGRGRVGGRGDAGAEEQRALAADARTRIALGPAEAAGALAQTLHEVPAAERFAAVGLPLGFVADAQFHRVRAERVGEFVHGRLQGVHAGCLAGGAHPGRAGHVERDHPVGAEQGRGGVHDPGGHRGLLDELPYPGGVGGRLVQYGGQPAVRVRAEAESLQGGGAVADGGGQVAAGVGEGDGPAGALGGHGSEDDVGARGALGAEAAADVLGDDGDPVLGQLEQLGEHLPHGRAALTGGVHGEPVPVPVGRAGVRLHGVIVQRRHPVGDIDADLGGGVGGLRVAVLDPARIAGVGLLRLVGVRVTGVQLGLVRFDRVGDAHRPRGGAGPLQGVGDGQGHAPATVRHVRALEDGQRRVLGRGEAGASPGVRTARTPGRARAAEVSTPVTRPRAIAAGTGQA
ncbi:hypothetical protein BFF78_05755 [Streptomyces fodineus]|uniref:Uncharacterized protein n=1 Tax=Streptomyces fodineus TaxID=1904616 RepID=A0A1D7Y4S5_9ACTN|nr:hypothetical protein BFF78_05755 [Streptomyces fodineus]